MSLNYERALEKLRQLASQTDWDTQFNILAVALQENLGNERLFGTTEQIRHERYRLIFQLDQLTRMKGLTTTFSDLCQDSNQLADKGPDMWKQEIGSQQNRIHLGNGNRWAVLVGVNEYIDTRTYGRLQVCTRDATALSKQLSSGGYDTEHVRLLTDHDTSLPPSRAQILTTLHYIAEATEPEDLLLFYFSGHGLVENGESYLIPRDGTGALHYTAIAVHSIKEIMISAQAQAKVIILDACHSGAATQTKGKHTMSEEFINDVFKDAEGLAIISSCQVGQLSYEWPEKKSSAFTYYLLEALQGRADQDEKGFITVQDVNRYVTHEVKQWAVKQQVPQSPRMHYTVTGDIVIASYQQDNKNAHTSSTNDTNNVNAQLQTKQLPQQGEIEIHKNLTSTNEDILGRYHTVPLHALLLYTDEDTAISFYLTQYWTDLDQLTDNICDIYPIVEQFRSPGEANAYIFIRQLDVLRAAHFDAYDQLPVLFFWDQYGKNDYISFGNDPDLASIRQTLRLIFGELHRQPTIFTVTEVKKKLQQQESHSPISQQPKQKGESLVEDNMNTQRARLYDILQRFTDDLDLREICLEVDISYNRLRGDSHAERAFSLATTLYNQARLAVLYQALHKRLPDRFS